MKSAPSSSSSPFSATSSTTFNDDFCTDKPFISSCLSIVLRRFFKSRTLPTYPADQIKEDKMGIQNPDQGSATPTIVARLMGLDSMPDITFSNAQKVHNSIPPSKSMEWEIETTTERSIQHRRTKTSVSFREMPTYFELEDDDFFVLNFENGDKPKKLRSRNANSEMGMKGRRRRRKGGRNRVKLKKVEDDGKGLLLPDYKEMLRLRIMGENEIRYSNGSSTDGIHSSRRKKINESCIVDRKAEAECDPENCSPVSILDDCEFIGDPEVTTSSEEDTVSKATSKLLSELLCQEYPSDYYDSSHASTKQDKSELYIANEGGSIGQQQKIYQGQKHFQMLNNKTCKLAESEVVNSCWKYNGMWKNDEWEDVAATFGHYIFDQLINEFVDQLLRL